MPIGPEILLKLVKEKGLVTNLSERELTNPEGAGFDLRLGEIHKIDESAEPEIGIEKRKTPETEILAKFKEGKSSTFKLRSGKYVLAKTMESVNLPKDISADIFTRSSLFRAGLILLCTQTAPGYQGELIFGLFNAGPVTVSIELGARIAHIQFERVEGGGSLYRGQNQGGRVTSQGKSETQV